SPENARSCWNPGAAASGTALEPPGVGSEVHALEHAIRQVAPERDHDLGAAPDDIAHPGLLSGERLADHHRDVLGTGRRALDDLVGDVLARPEQAVIRAGRVVRTGGGAAVLAPALGLDNP